MAGTKTVKDMILQRANQHHRVFTSTQLQETISKVVHNLLSQSKKEQDIQFKQAHRLAGKTLFKAPPLLGLQLETSYGGNTALNNNDTTGQYGQSYVVFIEYDPKMSKMKVKSSTLPYFIPLRRIEQMFLNQSIKVCEYCNILSFSSFHISYLSI